jgi:hypothetical protein
MKSIAFALVCLLAPCQGAGDWDFLGDDASVEKTIHKSEYVFMGAIKESVLEHVSPPFAEVCWTVRAIDEFKGKLPSDTVIIKFPTDSLPTDKSRLDDFMKKHLKNDAGSVRFFFIRKDQMFEPGRFSCEWVDSAEFSSDHYLFLAAHRAKAEQGAVATPN